MYSTPSPLAWEFPYDMGVALKSKKKSSLVGGAPWSTGIFPWPKLPPGGNEQHYLLYPSQGRLYTHFKDNEN